MTDITPISDWFKKAVPNPTQRNTKVQIGCHFEEVVEMFTALGCEAPKELVEASNAFKEMDDLYAAKFNTTIDRKELLDSLCDQIVTAVGVAYMLGMDIQGALDEVNASNWSKFENGEPVFLENGKIGKGKDYFKPKLNKFIGK
ncbi:nucleoside triphosphate pyrophosphohydrolase family protein [Pasteurellaceae bacterium HPA106]|uniref:nucleoside triphosphate pyrophosphohydrolase family protein n=1 Tax=Spirabiliibacterium pneumoniae TaxID=221400 RepID=UPI001AACC04D|nr:nucleoside triphosphate pyrophosphohydrolase family protein [Spirabiliibacterium pneumoniae]MBE2895750.1 nucleoside triphosphate pyrophosphohydrolase family protein [Spirabiliibacterium pneumoniae]